MRLWLTAVIVVSLGGVAAADKDRNKADSLFKQGKKLMSEKRYADACTAFEDSFKFDPAIGTELNLAKCYEEWGKLGRAYRSYQKAEEMANQAKDPRAPKIHDLITALDKDVPRLTIKLPDGTFANDVRVTLDGTALDGNELGKPQLVDPGPHVVEYHTGSEPKKNKVVPVERGGAASVTLDLPGAVKEHEPEKEHEKEREPEEDRTTRAAPDPWRNRRLLSYGLGGGGGLMIGISFYMGLSARSKYKDALSAHCGGMTSTCDSQGLSATHDARTEANIATVLFLLGAGAVGGGVYLYMTTPHGQRRNEHALHVVPVADPHGGGLVVGGAF